MFLHYFGKLEVPIYRGTLTNNSYLTHFMSWTGPLIMSQQLLKVSTLCPHKCTKMAPPVVNCFVSEAQVHVILNVQVVDIIYLRQIVCYLQRKYIQRIFNIN